MQKYFWISIFFVAGNLFAQVNAIVEDSEGRILVAKENRLLEIHADGRMEPLNNISMEQPISAVAADETGSLWIGTDQGLWRCNTGSCKREETGGSMHVRSLAVDSNENLWIGTDRGLLKLSAHVEKQDAIHSGTVDAIRFDRNNALWIGSGFELIRWQHGKKRTFDLPPPPPNVRMRPPITSILPTKSGKVYVGTRNALLLLAGNQFRKVSDLNVLSLFEDNKGNIWIGTPDGLNRMSDGKIIKDRRL